MRRLFIAWACFVALEAHSWDLNDCAREASLAGQGMAFPEYGPTAMSIGYWDPVLNIGTGRCFIYYGPLVVYSPSSDDYRRPGRKCGSIIRVDQLTLGESIPIAGTDEKLSYNSNRAVGREVDYTFNLPLTGSSYDPDLSSITVEVDIAGQHHSYSYTTLSNDMMFSFTWDGKDNSSAWVVGAAPAVVSVHHYFVTSGVPDIPRLHNFVAGRYKALQFGGLGGWTISSIHFYDPIGQTLYLGNGDTMDAELVMVDRGAGGEIEIVSGPSFDFYMVVNKDGKEAYLFNANGRHVETRSTLTGAVLKSFGYNGSGLIESITDAYSNVISITRPSGSVIEIQAPNGQITTLALDGSGRVISVEDPMSHEYEMTYNGAGLLATFEQPSGALSEFTYDASGLLTKDEHSAGAFIDLWQSMVNGGSYTQASISATTAEGRESTYMVTSYLSGTGFERTETYPSGASGYYGYSVGATIYDVVNPGPYLTLYRTADPRFGSQAPYVSGWDLSSGTQSSSATVALSTTFSSTDVLNLTSDSELKTVDSQVWSRAYNGTTKADTYTSPEGRIRTVKYNSYNQVTETQVASLAPVVYAYDVKGRLHTSTQSSRVTTINYNAAGFVSSVQNPASQTTLFTYYDNGKVHTQTLPDSRVLTYTYDDNGNMTSLETATSNTHGFLSNLYNLMASYTAPILSSTNYVTSYAYNNDKQLTQITRPDSTTISYDYGTTTGLLDQVTTTEGDYDLTYSYDQVTQITSPQSVTNNFSYDSDMVSSATTTTGSFVAGISYTRSQLKVASATVTDNSSGTSAINYGYDNDNLLVTAGDMTVTRDPDTGIVAETELGDVQEIYSYNATYGEVAVYQVKYSGSEIYKETYTRDLLGRITTKVIAVNGSTTATYGYVYDTSGRLHEVWLNSTLVRTYNYNDNSSRTSLVAGSTVTGTYDAQDRILTYGSKTYAHTMNGFLSQITDGANTTNLTYDSLGGLTEAEIITPGGTDTYTYLNDALGRRIEKSKNMVLQRRYIYDEFNRLVAELNSSGDLASHFVYATKSHCPDYMIQSGTKYKFVQDQLGSVIKVVNASTGAVASSLTYDEFGNVTASSSPNFQPFGFACGIHDHDVRLVRFGARDYDPETGRWTSKDPILFNGGDMNLYGYVLADPVNLIDPTGNNPLIAAPILGGVTGAIIGGISAGINGGNIGTGAWSGFVGGATAGLGLATGFGAGAAIFAGTLTNVLTALPDSGADPGDVGNGFRSLLEPKKKQCP